MFRTLYFVILFGFTVNLCRAQELSGKWYLRDNGQGSHLDQDFLQVIRIADQKVVFYNDFVMEDIEFELSINKDGLITDKDNNFIGFETVDKERIKLLLKTVYFEKDTIIPFIYIRLVPTKTDLTLELIENLTYLDIEDGQIKSTLKFNQELWDEEMLRINNTTEGEMYRILKIDSTLLLARYIRGIRKSLLPIKEATHNYILLYGVPEGTDEIIGRY